MSGRLQDADIKSVAELGGNKDRLPSSAKVYIGQFGANKTLAESVDERLLHGKPMLMHQGSTPDAKLYIDPSTISNIEGLGLTITPIEELLPQFVASTVNFQTQATTGAAFNVVFPASTVGRFRRAALTALSNGTITINFSIEALTVGALADPSELFVGGGLPLGFIDLECTNVAGQFKTAGSATNIIENKVGSTPRIFVFGVGAGGGPANNGRADSVALTSGQTSVTVVFSSPVTNVNYKPVAQLVTTDSDPIFQPIIITNKTVNGFTAKWNVGLDSNNYVLDYNVPGTYSTVGEVPIPNAASSIVITLAVPFSNTNYVVAAEQLNSVDSDPQFQPMVVIAKTATTFTIKWNSPTDSGNYKLSYQASAFA